MAGRVPSITNQWIASVDEGSHEAAKRPANLWETLAVTDENFKAGVS